MIRILLFFLTSAFLLTACRSTRNIQTAIAPKDTTAVVVASTEHPHEDSVEFIKQTYSAIQKNYIDYKTFSGKIDVDYIDAEEKKYNVTAIVRMRKDSVIWISITGIFNVEGLRAYITPDSVKIINKQDRVYIARSVEYLQDMTALPLTLSSLQDLLVGNPVYLDSNIVSYTKGDDAVTLLSVGDFFKNLITISQNKKLVQMCKLDDIDDLHNRTCYLTYSRYEPNDNFSFPTRRHITVTEKKKLEIDLDYKKYQFNETLSFPFSVPKNYKPK